MPGAGPRSDPKPAPEGTEVTTVKPKPRRRAAGRPRAPKKPPPTRSERALGGATRESRRQAREIIPSGVAGTGPDLKAGPVQAPIIPLLLIGIGGYFMWFGIHYWRGDLKWPSDPVKSVLQGKGLPPASAAAPQSALLTAYEAQENSAGATPAAGGGTQAPVASGAAQNTAKLLLSKFGWAASELGPLIKLWNQESGWSSSAKNTSSGAYGIAQALGHGQAGTAAPDGTNEYGAEYGLTAAEAQQANAGSTTFQIMWGLGYIQAVYGTPAAAWAHEQQFGWY